MVVGHIAHLIAPAHLGPGGALEDDFRLFAGGNFRKGFSGSGGDAPQHCAGFVGDQREHRFIGLRRGGQVRVGGEVAAHQLHGFPCVQILQTGEAAFAAVGDISPTVVDGIDFHGGAAGKHENGGCVVGGRFANVEPVFGVDLSVGYQLGAHDLIAVHRFGQSGMGRVGGHVFGHPHGILGDFQIFVFDIAGIAADGDFRPGIAFFLNGDLGIGIQVGEDGAVGAFLGAQVDALLRIDDGGFHYLILIGKGKAVRAEFRLQPGEAGEHFALQRRIRNAVGGFVHEGLEGFHRVGGGLVIRAGGRAFINTQGRQGLLQRAHRRAGHAGLQGGDGGGGRVVGHEDFYQFIVRNAGGAAAQHRLDGLDGPHHGFVVEAVGFPGIEAQGDHTVLQIRDGFSLAVIAQLRIVGGHADEFGVGFTTVDGVGLLIEQFLEIIVAGVVIVKGDLGARKTVIRDPLGVFDIEANAAVGSVGAHGGVGFPVHVFVVFGMEQIGMEQVAAHDAAAEFAVAVFEGIPVAALELFPLGGHGVGAPGGFVSGHAAGADHLPHYGIVQGAVDGDDVIGEIHPNVIGRFRRGDQGQRRAQKAQAQKHQDDSFADHQKHLFHLVERPFRGAGCR